MTDILTVETIKMNGTASSKEDAIRQAGELLVKGECVTPEYIDGMLARRKNHVYLRRERRCHPPWSV